MQRRSRSSGLRRQLLHAALSFAAAQSAGCTGEIKLGFVPPDAGEEVPVDDDPPGLPGQPTPTRDASTPGTVRQDGGGRSPVADANTPQGGNDGAVVVTEPPRDAGMPPVTVPDAGMPTNTKGTPVFVVVGYSGVRLVSRDLGKTWGNIVTSGGSGDDNNLLRSVAFNNGTFVAAGWRIWSTTDGVNWTERTNTSKQWVGGLKFGNNLFVGAGGFGTSVYSSDGITWNAGAPRANNEPARTVAYGNGMFMAATDPLNWWSTTDGKAWTLVSGGHKSTQIMWCKDKFTDVVDCTDPLARNNGRTVLGEGVYISAAGSSIERSTDGKTWTKVQDTSQYAVEDVAFGYLK